MGEDRREGSRKEWLQEPFVNCDLPQGLLIRNRPSWIYWNWIYKPFEAIHVLGHDLIVSLSVAMSVALL